MRVWVGMGIVAGSLVGLGAYFAAVGLDRANKLASVIGVFVGVFGLLLALAGLMKRDDGSRGQLVEGSVIAGEVSQISGTKGSVRIRHTAPPETPMSPGPLPVPPPTGPTATPSNGQTVRGSHISGPLDQIKNTDGDVELGP
jgi:hypothetical protein